MPRWIRTRAFPIRDHHGEIFRIGGIASDITEEKQAFAALIETEQLAIAGRMAASLAHEINNPLQAAIGCLDLSLEQLSEGKEPHQHLQVTAQALDRASRVVAQLRALHYPLETESKQPSDLNQLLQNMLLLTEKRCLDQGVEVDWQANADLPPVMLVPDAMEQVCLNLLLNALEAMPQGGRLAVGTRRTEDPAGIWIEVRDTGHGIPADELEHLFEPFYSTKPHSLGLGLFISHNIVLEHGGHMEVDSQEGEGTTFGIWLPLSEPEVNRPS
jgi:two-component system NtrC family sensor kinase